MLVGFVGVFFCISGFEAAAAARKEQTISVTWYAALRPVRAFWDTSSMRRERVQCHARYWFVAAAVVRPSLS